MLKKILITLFTLIILSASALYGINYFMMKYSTAGCLEVDTHELISKKSINHKKYYLYKSKTGLNNIIQSISLYESELSLGGCGVVEDVPVDQVIYARVGLPIKIPSEVYIKNKKIIIKYTDVKKNTKPPMKIKVMWK